MLMPNVAEPLSPATAIEVACAHCGLPVPAGVLSAGDERQFCCSGCRTAWGILHEHGLERYYELPDRRDRPVR
jgi:Cu2+-exporting ATPase